MELIKDVFVSLVLALVIITYCYTLYNLYFKNTNLIWDYMKDFIMTVSIGLFLSLPLLLVILQNN